MSVHDLIATNENVFRGNIIVDGVTYSFAHLIPPSIDNLCVKTWMIEIIDDTGKFDLAIWTIEGSLTSI